MPAAVTASPEGFPPQDLRRFLELCEGEWLALRSHFDLAQVEAETPAAAVTAGGSVGGAAMSAPEAVATDVSPDGGGAADGAGDGLPDFAALLQQARAEVAEAPSEEAWHSSERAELRVAFLAPEQADQLGGLRVTPSDGGSSELHFRADGSFAAAAEQALAEQALAGQWQLWPDGSLELILAAPGRVLRERIWFTQPNLRLRSSVEHLDGGQPGRARFSSEIRRVRKPAA